MFVCFKLFTEQIISYWSDPIWSDSITNVSWCLQARTCTTPPWRTATAGFGWLWILVWTGWWSAPSCSPDQRFGTPRWPLPWPPRPLHAATSWWGWRSVQLGRRRLEWGKSEGTGSLCPGSDPQNLQVQKRPASQHKAFSRGLTSLWSPSAPLVPLRANRNVFLPLWNNVDYSGDVWRKAPPTEEEDDDEERAEEEGGDVQNTFLQSQK